MWIKGRGDEFICLLLIDYKNNSFSYISLQWHHDEHDGVSNHHCLDCLLNRLFRRRSMKTSRLHVTGLCVCDCVCVGGGGGGGGGGRGGGVLGVFVSPSSGEFPAQWSVMQKMFPFDDVIVPLLDLKHHIQLSRGYAYGILKCYFGKSDIGDRDCNITSSGEFPAQWSVMQKMFPFVDVIVPLLDLKHHIQLSRGYAYGILKYYFGKSDIGDRDCNITVKVCMHQAISVKFKTENNCELLMMIRICVFITKAILSIYAWNPLTA